MLSLALCTQNRSLVTSSTHFLSHQSAFSRHYNLLDTVEYTCYNSQMLLSYTANVFLSSLTGHARLSCNSPLPSIAVTFSPRICFACSDCRAVSSFSNCSGSISRNGSTKVSLVPAYKHSLRFQFKERGEREGGGGREKGKLHICSLLLLTVLFC